MWFGLSRKPHLANTAGPRRSSARPRLEVLEDRTVPASLSYSTLLPGPTQVFATAVDNSGAVYVTGTTDSSLPTTPGAFQTSGSGAFVAKLNPAGNALDYATYLGDGIGPSAHSGYSIAVDAAGDAYVIGNNFDVPTTPNAIASSGSVFVAELNPTGSGLVYSTYLPGAVGYATTWGLAGAIAVDGSGNIDVAGGVQAGLPVTAGTFQSAYRGGVFSTNAFFTEINPSLSGLSSLVYSTYLGGSGSTGDAATGIALDGSGNAYLTGYTSSTDFPTTGGAFQRTYGGGMFDAFVAKINPSLSGLASLVYSTYLGGSNTDGYDWDGQVADGLHKDGGIAVDGSGNAYVTSGTRSNDFPTTRGAFQTKSGSIQTKNSSWASDAFVTKLNATGTGLVYSTYLGSGGLTITGGAGIALDASGDAHVTGWTNSTAFPALNALQATNGGGTDAIVTVFNPSGSGPLFSSYFGGSGNDYGFDIALDSGGNAYVGGETNSTNFPTTPGAYDTSGGHGFVLKIDPPAGEPVTGVAEGRLFAGYAGDNATLAALLLADQGDGQALSPGGHARHQN